MTRSDATHTGPTGARILTAVRGYAFGTAAPKVLVLFIGMSLALAGMLDANRKACGLINKRHRPFVIMTSVVVCSCVEVYLNHKLFGSVK